MSQTRVPTDHDVVAGERVAGCRGQWARTGIELRVAVGAPAVPLNRARGVGEKAHTPTTDSGERANAEGSAAAVSESRGQGVAVARRILAVLVQTFEVLRARPLAREQA